jgi:hypothetical protein
VLVNTSRVRTEARFYTDGIEAFEARLRMETGHRENAVDFVEEMLPDKEVKEQAADLQKDASRSAREAFRRAEAHERHVASPRPRNASKAKAWSTEWGCNRGDYRFKPVQVVRHSPARRPLSAAGQRLGLPGGMQLFRLRQRRVRRQPGRSRSPLELF